MWKSTAEQGRPQSEIWRTRIACWIPKATNIQLGLCINRCFPTATMVASTRLIVTLYVHWLHCLMFNHDELQHVEKGCKTGIADNLNSEYLSLLYFVTRILA